MYMRMGFVGMQNEGIPVLAPELLPREVANRSQHFVWCRSRRHRKHYLMNELWRLSAVRGTECFLSPHVVDIEVPIVQEVISHPAAKTLSVVGFQFELSFATDIVHVFTHRFKIVA
jgi:hypothetical protein